MPMPAVLKSASFETPVNVGASKSVVAAEVAVQSAAPTTFDTVAVQQWPLPTPSSLVHWISEPGTVIEHWVA